MTRSQGQRQCQGAGILAPGRSASTTRRRCRQPSWRLLWLLLWLALWPSARATANSKTLAQAGRQALARGDTTTARTSLEEAYAQAPANDLLYDLGLVARAEQRPLAAADLFLRYQEDAGPAVPPERRATIAAHLALPAVQDQPRGEVFVTGDRGALLRVDGRLAGALPLAQHLLLAPGGHRLRLTQGHRMVETALELPRGRPLAVSFTFSPPLALVQPTSAVLLALEAPPALVDGLQQVVDATLRKERAVPVRAPAPKDAAPCALDQPCQEDRARAASATLLLRVRAVPAPEPAGAPTRIEAVMVDLSLGAEAARASVTCSPDRTAQALGALVARVLQEATTRGRGTLQVDAGDPSARGAAVRVDGRAVGVVPVTRELFTGHHRVRIERPRYLPCEEDILLRDEQTTRLLAVLTKPPPRPLRAAALAIGGLGAAAVLAGGLVIGLASPVGRNCGPGEHPLCFERLDPLATGLAVLGPGAAGVGVAGLLLILDLTLGGKRHGS